MYYLLIFLRRNCRIFCIYSSPCIICCLSIEREDYFGKFNLHLSSVKSSQIKLFFLVLLGTIFFPRINQDLSTKIIVDDCKR
ncbi:hypothetical protein OIU77_006042 [Salix suchowensis]|uniref:Uncharacterized protein n=1 Tax=Salix suchowensis TaxID=1278906 RepID=A0ABQ9ASQ4_9ROSI|nr:hypothetical protein OIU77_006042 [Salix suchowensis]